VIWHSPGGFTYYRHETSLDVHEYIEFDGVTYEVMDVINDRIDSTSPAWYRVVMV
jgi:hypothetical protein